MRSDAKQATRFDVINQPKRRSMLLLGLAIALTGFSAKPGFAAQDSQSGMIKSGRVLEIGRSADSRDDVVGWELEFSPSGNRLGIGKEYPLIWDFSAGGFYEVTTEYEIKEAAKRAKETGFPVQPHKKRIGLLVYPEGMCGE